MSTLMLNPKSSLEEKDLSRVYSHYMKSSVPDNVEASFKKNEKVGSMAKSMLKHRIQSLTGKNIGTLEKELGVPSPPQGAGLDVESLRKLSYWLILEANGDLTSSLSPGKRSHASTLAQTEEEDDDEVSLNSTMPSGMKKMKKTTRQSMIHESTLHSSSPSLNKTNPLVKNRRKSMAPELLAINEKVDCRLQEEKPTQAMLDVASRRGRPSKTQALITHNNNSINSPSKSNLTKKIAKPKVAKPKASFSGAVSLPDGTRNEIYIAQGSPFRLRTESIGEEIPSFPGATLCLIHTPEDWMSPEIYLAIESVVDINHERGMDSFLLLVKCDVENAASTRLSLTTRFTQHVQFLVLHCSEAHPEDEGPSSRFKMKEACSSYFLAYFFPGCEKEGSVLSTKMMREEGMTNCITAKTEEDLENKIVGAFTELGDWILDVAGRGGSETILSAQKSGRNGIMIDDDETVLEDIQEKAVKIANYHDKNFRDVDGDIIALK